MLLLLANTIHVYLKNKQHHQSVKCATQLYTFSACAVKDSKDGSKDVLKYSSCFVDTIDAMPNLSREELVRYVKLQTKKLKAKEKEVEELQRTLAAESKKRDARTDEERGEGAQDNDEGTKGEVIDISEQLRAQIAQKEKDNAELLGKMKELLRRYKILQNKYNASVREPKREEHEQKKKAVQIQDLEQREKDALAAGEVLRAELKEAKDELASLKQQRESDKASEVEG